MIVMCQRSRTPVPEGTSANARRRRAAPSRRRTATIAPMLLSGLLAIASPAGAQLLPPPEPPKDPQPYELVTKPGPMEQAEFRKMLVGKTWLSYDGRHGTQVTFIAADGRAFLWYPGNTVILPSRWTISERKDSFLYRHPGGAGQSFHMLQTAVICFQYGPNTYNPVTGNRSRPECGTPGTWQRTHFDERPGDPLGLARMKAPPFVLDKQKTTFDDLIARVRKGR